MMIANPAAGRSLDWATIDGCRLFLRSKGEGSACTGVLRLSHSRPERRATVISTFIMGIAFLTLAHICVATGLGPRIKWSVIGLAFFSSQADIAGPWLIRYGSPAFALLQLSAWLGMWVGYGVLILLPLHEMWGRGRQQSQEGKTENRRAKAP